MQYHWLRDPVLRKEFIVLWEKIIENKADYYTKHFAPMHHVQMRQTSFIPKKTCISVEKKIFVPARTVSMKTARTPIILPRVYNKSSSPTVVISPFSQFKNLPLNSPVVNNMTLQGCVSTKNLPILPCILSLVFVR